MNINTSRFGSITVDEESILSFPEGIPGFEHTRRYAIVPHRTMQGHASPFRWLQSLDEPSLALPVINPWSVRPDYAPTVAGLTIKQLGITDIREQAQFLTVVTIPVNNPAGITVNLLAPIMVNRITHVAKQVIVQNESYSIRTPILTLPVEAPLPSVRCQRELSAVGAAA